MSGESEKLWSDKHRPKSLDDLTYHTDLSDTLRKLASAGEFPHLLFYGSSGAGKKTRIMALLNELFGSGVYRLRSTVKPYKVSKSKTIDLAILSSPYHIEMNPADAGIHDRVIVQQVLKNMASVSSMNSKTKRRFKVVLLEEVDHLTKAAQHALRRTMEKYMANCRLILCCESVSKVIDPLRSRCLAIRVPAPTKNEIIDTLNTIAIKENTNLPPKFADRIADKCNRNLRRALLMMQASYVDTNGQLQDDSEVKKYPWEEFIEEIINRILEEQRPQVLSQARLKVYELTTNCIPPTLILRKCADRIMENVDDSLKMRIAYWAAFHEQRMQISQKKVPHIVAFLARVMQIYKEWADSFFS